MMIARRASLAMTGMLLIDAVLNSHSLVHDSIARWFEAIMEDHIQLLTTRRDGEIDDDDDGNNYVRRNRKLVDRQSPNSSNSSNNEIESLDQSLLSFLSDSALGRQKVIEFMIDQYVSPTTPDDNMIDKLDNAMEAISLLETDGEPIQVGGYPFLFVGSVGTSALACHITGTYDVVPCVYLLKLLDTYATILQKQRCISQPQGITRHGHYEHNQLVFHRSVSRLR
jgi:hypothetical protein